MIEIITDLEKRKIGFCSLQENIDTTTSGGRLIFHVFGALLLRLLISGRYSHVKIKRSNGTIPGVNECPKIAGHAAE